MPEVLRGLRRGPGPGFACSPIYFVTASPPQLRKVLERKMTIDGVECDGILFKDWIATLLDGRPGRLREQVGFKICALLTARMARPRSREFLFGDDVESDAVSYSLYARLLDREHAAGGVEDRLAKAGVARDDRRCIRSLLDRLGPAPGTVERSYIHLEAGTPPARFRELAPGVVPVRGAIQLALALFQEGLLRVDAVRDTVDAVTRLAPATPVADLVRDAVDRGLVKIGTATSLSEMTKRG